MNPPVTTSSRSAYADRLREFSTLAFADQAAQQHRGTWRDLFANRIGSNFNGQIIFEIGCFNAKYLSTIAAAHPQTAFIGLDWKCKPLYDGARHITDLNLNNIVLLRARAQDIAKIFADQEVDEIWIFHPDPCDKPAELKNRLISEPFLIAVHTVLRNAGSVLALKTDHAGYHQSMLSLFLEKDAYGRSGVQAQYDLTCNSSNYWLDLAVLERTSSRCFAKHTTLFETRFLKKRKPIYYLELAKRS